MAADPDCGFEILPHSSFSPYFAPLHSTCFRDVLKAMKVSWRRAMSLDVEGDYIEK
jgi:hypothetical protein